MQVFKLYMRLMQRDTYLYQKHHYFYIFYKSGKGMNLVVLIFTSESICRAPVSIHQASSTTRASTRHTTTIVIGLTAPRKSSVLLGRLLVVTSHLMGLVLGTMVSANHQNKREEKNMYVYVYTHIHTTHSSLQSVLPHAFWLKKCLIQSPQSLILSLNTFSY